MSAILNSNFITKRHLKCWQAVLKVRWMHSSQLSSLEATVHTSSNAWKIQSETNELQTKTVCPSCAAYTMALSERTQDDTVAWSSPTCPAAWCERSSYVPIGPAQEQPFTWRSGLRSEDGELRVPTWEPHLWLGLKVSKLPVWGGCPPPTITPAGSKTTQEGSSPSEDAI